MIEITILKNKHQKRNNKSCDQLFFLHTMTHTTPPPQKNDPELLFRINPTVNMRLRTVNVDYQSDLLGKMISRHPDD